MARLISLFLALYIFTILQGKDYYVKLDGTGDGSSWINAMSDKDFATKIAEGEEDMVFHLAEGVYHGTIERESGLRGWDYSTKAYEIKTNVTLIGGYSSDVTDISTKPQPQKYKTILSGDFNHDDEPVLLPSTFGSGKDSVNINNTDDNDPYLIEVTKDDITLSIYGIKLTGASLYCIFTQTPCKIIMNKCEIYDNGGAGLYSIEDVELYVDSCTFYRNGVNSFDQAIGLPYSPNSLVKNSHFEYNGKFFYPSGAIFVGNGQVENCTFYKNFGRYGSGVYIIQNGSVKNCTFVENEVFQIAPAVYFPSIYTKDTIQSCTFINNKYYDIHSTSGTVDKFADAELVFTGNIIVGDGLYTWESVEPDPNLTSRNNILTGEMQNIRGNFFLPEEDTIVSLEEIAHLLDGKIENGTFVANLKENGGSLKTVALKCDTFTNGQSIRYPLTELFTHIDQNANNRLDLTVPGALEFFEKCSPDTTLLSTPDTIQVGENFLNQTFTTVGVHDSIFERLKSADGCDSLVMHRVVVKPDPSVLNYYVKTDGTGDGSSWEKAMNNETFAKILPTVNDGTTFHFAQGVYKPVYDKMGYTTAYTSQRTYTIKSSVTFVGGYPENPEPDAVSQPDKYKAIFSGDILNDDVVEMVENEYDIKVPEISGTEDNSSCLFYTLKDNIDLKFIGLDIMSSSYVTIHTNYGTPSTLTLESCRFSRLNGYGLDITSSISREVSLLNCDINSCLCKFLQVNAEKVILRNISAQNSFFSYFFDSQDSKEIDISGLDVRKNVFSSPFFLTINAQKTSLSSSVFDNNQIINRLLDFQNGNVYLSNVEFINNKCSTDIFFTSSNCNESEMSNVTFKGNISNYSIIENFSESTILDSCLFINNESRNLCLLNGVSTVSNSIIDGNRLSNSLLDLNGKTGIGQTYIFGNTFSNNSCDIIIHPQSSSLDIRNNTIALNTANSIIVASGMDINLYNNTIVGNTIPSNLTSLSGCNLVLEGNVILGNSTSEDVEMIWTRWTGLDKSSVKNNIVPFVNLFVDEFGECGDIRDDIWSNNIMSFSPNEKISCDAYKDIVNRNEEILTTLFEGSYDPATGLFTPVLKNNGGFTPTVALKIDKLLDGTSIRFPRLDGVLTDQRGVERLDMTCMGAYELACSPDTTLLSDTISVGETYTFGGENVGSTITKAGTYDFRQTLKNSGGCDSVVILKLSVQTPDTIHTVATICQGTDYTENEWNIQLKDYIPGTYTFEREYNETKIEKIEITIKSNISFTARPIEVQKPSCHGGTDASLIILAETDDDDVISLLTTISANEETFQSENDENGYVRFDDLAAGDYTIKIADKEGNGCISDTTFITTIEDGDQLRVEGEDTLLTFCHNEPDAQADFELFNYDPSVNILLNGKALNTIGDQYGNKLIFKQNKTFIRIKHASEGTHTIEASDKCGNKYEIHKFTVEGYTPLDFSTTLSSAEDICSKDETILTINKNGGSPHCILEISSEDEKRNYDIYDGAPTKTIEGLQSGHYTIKMKTSYEYCSDAVVKEIDITRPDPLNLYLMVNGIACKDAVIQAYASGENGTYSYTWTNEAGDTIGADKERLSNIGAGKYRCTVRDSKGCAEVTDEAIVQEVSGLSKLKVLSLKEDETCFGFGNTSLTAVYYNNNDRQAVTCTLTDKNTNKQVFSATSMRYLGGFALKGIAPGEYEMRLRYGTENCIIDHNETIKDFTIKGKDKPLTIGTPKIKNQTCANEPNGAVEIEVEGWEDGYEAYFGGKSIRPVSATTDGNATFTISNLTSGNYEFEIKDDCEETEQKSNIIIKGIKPLNLTLTPIKSSLECAKSMDGEVILTATGGNEEGMALYGEGLIDTIVKGSAEIALTNLKGGEYTIEYRSEEDGCSDHVSSSFEIQDPKPLAVDFDIEGLGCTKTKIKANASGENGAYAFFWKRNDSQFGVKTVSNISPFSLAPGDSATCTVWSKNNCDTITHKIFIPKNTQDIPLAMDVMPIMQTCANTDNGKISVRVNSSLSKFIPVTINISNIETGENLTHTILPMVSKGRVFKDLAPGSYAVKAYYGTEDCHADSKEAIDTVEIEKIRPLKIVSVESQNRTCINEDNARLAFKVDGWNENHRATLFRLVRTIYPIMDITPTKVDGQTALFEVPNLNIGLTYILRIMDNCGNTIFSEPYRVDSEVQPYELRPFANVYKDKLDCNYSKDAYIALKADGGHDKTSVLYHKGSPNDTIDASIGIALVSELGAGVHRFVFKTTQEGCSDSAEYKFKVSERNPISYTAILEGEECKNQKIVAEIDGGNAPISVDWFSDDKKIETDVNGEYTLSGVGAGSFSYKIRDAKGCEYNSERIEANLFDPDNDALKIESVETTDLTCYGTTDGSVKLNFSGNDLGHKLLATLEGENSTDTIRTDKTAGELRFDNLSAGKYVATIIYELASQCSPSANGSIGITVLQPDPIETSMTHTDAVCDTISGGSISLMIKGGTTPYTVQWQETSMKTDLETHTTEGTDLLKSLPSRKSFAATVTDAHGCKIETDTATMGIAPQTDLTSFTIKSVKSEDESCYRGGNGAVEVSYGNNSSKSKLKLLLTKDDKLYPAEYTNNNLQTGTLRAEALEPGTYDLYLDIDLSEYGCEKSLSPLFLQKIDIKAIEKPLKITNVTTKIPTCVSKPNGEITFSIEGWNDRNSTSVIIGEDTATVKPTSVKDQVANFELKEARGGELRLSVSDVCKNEAEITPEYGGESDYSMKITKKRTKLRCNYSEDGFIELTLHGGALQNSTFFSTKIYTDSIARDTLTNTKESLLFSGLAPAKYIYKVKTNVENCPDSVEISETVTVPRPIVFDKATDVVTCTETGSGEINFVPHIAGYAPKWVKADETRNLIDKIYFGEKLDFFGIKSIEITGKGLSKAEMDSLIFSSVVADTAVENNNKCDYIRGDTCINVKKIPMRDFWKDIDISEFNPDEGSVANHKYPEFWAGIGGLPGTTFYVKATDDSLCTFTDSFEVKSPSFKYLTIDTVIYDAKAAFCHAEERRVEINVSGGWGNYSYIIIPEADNDTTSTTAELSDSQSYKSDEIAIESNGHGFYRSEILAPGKYHIGVSDDYGCTRMYDKTFDIEAQVIIDTYPLADPCGSDTTNRVEVNAFTSKWRGQGSPQFAYALRYEDTSLSDTLHGDFKRGEHDGVILEDIPQGKIGVFAYQLDGNGCSGYQEFTVKHADSVYKFNVAPLAITDALCFGDSSGSILFNAVGANPPYTSIKIDGNERKDFLIYDGDFNQKEPSADGIAMLDSVFINNLTGGNHILTVIDSKECEKSIDFEIRQPRKLSLAIKASAVCPDSDEGRIIAEKTFGGTSPYFYSLDSLGEYSKYRFLSSGLGETRHMYVKDKNGCIAKSTNTAAVNASIDWGEVKPDVMVSSWQNFEDVLVFIDVTSYKNNEIRFDSATIEPYGITIEDRYGYEDSISFEKADPVIYTYGIPDSISHICLWNGDTIDGPLWGIPSDIAAGIKTQERFDEEKKRMDKEKNAFFKKLESLAEKARNTVKQEEKDRIHKDSIAILLRLDSLHTQERSNSTVDTIKKYFVPLVSETDTRRMTFLKLNSSLHSLESLANHDSVLFRYNFVHTAYLNDCNLSTDYNFSANNLYGIRVAEEGINPYRTSTRKDILECHASPNPADEDENVTLTVRMSRETEFNIALFNMLGQNLAENTSYTITGPVRTRDDISGGDIYTYTVSGIRLKTSTLIMVSTKNDSWAQIVIVY